MSLYTSLTKKLAALEKKLAAFIRLNSAKLIRKIGYEITQIEGKIEALTKKEKPKYSWDLKDGYGNVKNNENDKKYCVSAQVCSCPDWQKRRRFTGDNCKHQLMYFDLVGRPAKKEVLIEENACPDGTWLRRTDDWMSVEYEVWCYTEKYNHRTGFEIDQKFLGRIIQGKNEIFGATLKTIKGGFSSTENAINFLIRYNGLEPKKVAEIYYKQHPQQAYKTEVEPEEPKKKRNWLNLEELSSAF